LAAFTLAASVAIGAGQPAVAGPTPEEYVGHVGGDAQIVNPGELVLDA
jgi:hypothetical protein